MARLLNCLSFSPRWMCNAFNSVFRCTNACSWNVPKKSTKCDESCIKIALNFPSVHFHLMYMHMHIHWPSRIRGISFKTNNSTEQSRRINALQKRRQWRKNNYVYFAFRFFYSFVYHLVDGWEYFERDFISQKQISKLCNKSSGKNMRWNNKEKNQFNEYSFKTVQLDRTETILHHFKICFLFFILFFFSTIFTGHRPDSLHCDLMLSLTRFFRKTQFEYLTSTHIQHPIHSFSFSFENK